MGPTELHLELTHACPLNCSPCDHRLAGSAALDAAALEKLFRSPALKGLRLVSVSGGEPLLHREFSSILASAAAAFPSARLVVLTSLYPGGLAAALRGLPPGAAARVHIGSSLDGPPALHDSIRGRAGAFARIEKNLKTAREACPAASCGFTFTVSSLNAASFYGAWRAAVRRLRAPLVPQFLVPNPNTAGLEPGAGAMAALARGLRRALAVIASDPEAGSLYSAGERGQLEQALAFAEGSAAFSGGCGAGRTFALLSPEGRFYLCPFHKDVALGALDRPLSGFWTEAGASRAFRRAGRAACSRCFLRCAINL